MIEHTRPTSIIDANTAESREINFSEIPLIDLAPLYSDNISAKQQMAAELREACIQVGFFYVKNHGIPDSIMQGVQAQTERFFALPEHVKSNYDIGRIKRHRGFVPVGALTAGPDEDPDQQEGYEIALELPDDDPDYLAGSKLFGPNVWPGELPEFQPRVYAYFESVFQLGRKLFGAFALALDLPEGYFENDLTKPIAQLRLLYYPPVEKGGPEPQMGIGAHTDYECFTILWQTEPGLQVQNRKNEWVEALPVEDAFLVNIGDMMMRWTNDLFRSTPHRVVTRSRKKRYSFPFFFAADYNTVVRCLETCSSETNPPAYPPTKFGYWVENMHAYSYVYRHDERGKLPDPELER
ncbi:MAG TPA: isopenicillin N synthase family oxygenase [Gammaproteobacteria bacterium]|jgi:isopenicillin N synthase-like dioxygenase|uniref:Fe2OG dioxygenase domain-containing protein n=1 Tax=marine metagenome TaxID=408172 RepID=A0A382FLG4_9ZZZZ|nr:isopenicillin N synthase family oxygenase [Gammaproteobacteria bacterium]